MQNYELYHHGIMGMHWGVRRFQNEDGSLTNAGRARYDKVVGNEKLQERDRKDAIKLHEKELKTLSKAYKKNEKQRAAFEKHRNNPSNAAMADALAKRGEDIAKQSKAYSKRLSDITDGTIKAGRDFIIQRDYNFWAAPIPTPWGVGVIGDFSRDLKYVERKGY